MFEVIIVLGLAFCVGLFIVPLLGGVEKRLQRRADREAARQRHPSASNVTQLTRRE